MRRTPFHILPVAAPAMLSIAAAITMAAGPMHRAGGAPARSVSYPVRAMGTFVNVTLVTPDSTASLEQARAAHAAIRLVDSLMSNWTTTSEIARLNRVAD